MAETPYQVSFALTRLEKALLDSVATYYECTKLDLIRLWIRNAGLEIVQPLVDSYDAIETGEMPAIRAAHQVVIQATLDELDVVRVAG